MRFALLVLPELMLVLALVGLVPVSIESAVMVALLYFGSTVWWFFFAAIVYECEKRLTQRSLSNWVITVGKMLGYSLFALITILPFTALMFVFHGDSLMSAGAYLLTIFLFVLRSFIAVLMQRFVSGLQGLLDQIQFVGSHLFIFQVPAAALSVIIVLVCFEYGGEPLVRTYIAFLIALSAIVMALLRNRKKPLFEYTRLS